MEYKIIIATIEQLYLNWGFILVFLSSFIEITPLGWTIPGGLVVAIGGYFSYGSVYSFFLVITAGFLGSWSTLILSYILGRETGDWLVKKLKQGWSPDDTATFPREPLWKICQEWISGPSSTR